MSTKHKRINYLSYEAELLACKEAEDQRLRLKMAIRILLQDDTIKHMLTVSFKEYYNTSVMLHGRREYWLKQPVQRISNSFRSEDMDILHWIQQGKNIADELTEKTINAQRLLNQNIRTEIIALPKALKFGNGHEALELDP